MDAIEVKVVRPLRRAGGITLRSASVEPILRLSDIILTGASPHLSPLSSESTRTLFLPLFAHLGSIKALSMNASPQGLNQNAYDIFPRYTRRFCLCGVHQTTPLVTSSNTDLPSSYIYIDSTANHRL